MGYVTAFDSLGYNIDIPYISIPYPMKTFQVSFASNMVTIAIEMLEIPDAWDPKKNFEASFTYTLLGGWRPEDLPRLVAMMHIETQLHEAFEWIRTDGVLVASPHGPTGEFPVDGVTKPNATKTNTLTLIKDLVDLYMQSYPYNESDPNDKQPALIF